MKPRSIKIVQRDLRTNKERTAELCWRYLILISDWCQRRLTPSEVLDKMLWGEEVATDQHAYRIEP